MQVLRDHDQHAAGVSEELGKRIGANWLVQSLRDDILRLLQSCDVLALQLSELAWGAILGFRGALSVFQFQYHEETSYHA